MTERRRTIVTPEAVALSVDAAGLGSRMIALLIDTLIQGALALVVTVVAASIGLYRTPVVVVFSLMLFVLVWGYFPLWETFWRGRTPGKRAQHLRVVMVDGQPATAGPIFLRNLVRVADFLPGGYGVGAIAILLSRNSRRLGDLAAGTMVVRERAAPEPAPLAAATPTAVALDTAGLRQRDYVVVRDFLQRRSSLDSAARGALARTLADALRRRVGGTGPNDDEAFLESVAASFRERFSGETPAP